ncbi:MAG: hypothetical protein GX579_20605 [Chloroflexi bacterium]|nr:hypothetical protein [Chloroflexota bacterium]
MLLVVAVGCSQPAAQPTPTSAVASVTQAATTPAPAPTSTATGTATTAPPTPSPTGTSEATPTAEPTSIPATATPAPTPVPDQQLPQEAIVVDHNSVELFDQLPDEYIGAAAALRMLYIDRSVGKNIDDALNCLSAATDEEAPNHCRRFEHNVADYSVDPSELDWSRPGGYDRSNWHFFTWEGDCAGWSQKVDCFIAMVDPIIAEYDVVSFQFSYLEVADGSDIAAQPGGYFADNPTYSDVYDQEAYEAQHPDTVFIYWTTSLARAIGSTVAVEFNDQMRQYAIANGKPLFDVADILSHTPDGQPCYDNRDGVAYLDENHPDDGQDLLAICQEYTTETDGGHLGRVSTGKIRVAKAFWVLMARIAGWDGRPTSP